MDISISDSRSGQLEKGGERSADGSVESTSRTPAAGDKVELWFGEGTSPESGVNREGMGDQQGASAAVEE